MRIQINGIYVNVETEGAGPPLLLLHGFTGSVENWKPFLSSWAEKYRVIAVDVIGHGKSDAPADESRYMMQQAAQDLIHLLDYFEIERVNVLGYSMGGRLALTTAADYPERVNALLLESSSPGVDAPEERAERVKRDEALADEIEQLGIEAFVNRWEKTPLFSTQRSLSEDVRNGIRKQRLQNREIGLANSLRGMGTGKQEPVWSRLEQLQMPVMLVVGALDRKFCRIAERMSARLPDSQTVTVSDAGHAVHVEKTRMFDKIVMDDFYHLGKG